MDNAARFQSFRFLLIGTCVLLPALTGCGSYSRDDFWGNAYPACSQPAQTTRLSSESLMEKGYARIGRFCIQRERKDYTSEEEMTELLLDLAAKKGAELAAWVYCSKENVPVDAYQASHVTGGYTDYSGTRHTFYSAPELKVVFRDIYKIKAELWRHEPDLARAQLKDLRFQLILAKVLKSALRRGTVDRYDAEHTIPYLAEPASPSVPEKLRAAYAAWTKNQNDQALLDAIRHSGILEVWERFD